MEWGRSAEERASSPIRLGLGHRYCDKSRRHPGGPKDVAITGIESAFGDEVDTIPAVSPDFHIMTGFPGTIPAIQAHHSDCP
jgi:hypothetical protein